MEFSEILLEAENCGLVGSLTCKHVGIVQETFAVCVYVCIEILLPNVMVFGVGIWEELLSL